MVDLSKNRLLFIEPKNIKANKPVDDELTRKMIQLLREGKSGPAYKGHHTCICGESSGSCDIRIRDDYTTNSLAVHYLRWHRDEVPRTELAKLMIIGL